ncbi:MAG TPA: ABC transporter ATP-binding protein/permease [Candidatus Limnocylindrales bacterium]|nr:ABC transporter ATP-binding protein/permease [Candidatus Limnocylindrales bacterium]
MTTENGSTGSAGSGESAGLPNDATANGAGASTAKTFRQFRDISKAFFASSQQRKARGFLVVLLALALSVGGVEVLISYAGRDFMTAIAKKDSGAYWRLLGIYLGTFALAVPLGVYYRWTEHRLALLWREWLASHLIQRYFNNRAYYRLRGSDGVDNPDQRISEDVRNFTENSLSFLLIVLNSGVTLVAFLGVLWGISGLLVAVLFGYAIAGTILSVLIGKRLVRLSFQQYQKEADLRYGLVRVRDNAESIAFYRGESREQNDLGARLGKVVANTGLIINWNRRLAFFTTPYNYAAFVLPLAVVAPMFMQGRIEFGVVTQAVAAFAQVLAAVSLIITKFEGLSTYLAGVQRLGALWDNLDDFDADEARAALEAGEQLDEDSRFIRLDGLTVCTPASSGPTKTLVEELSFDLRRRQSLLIMGPSGTGKSSVLRTIAGLWPSGGGSLERPPLIELMFLPQRPYMVDGSLRDQLLYPYPKQKLTDDRIREVVEQVNLADVFARVDDDLDRVVDWTNVLSIGEQQRIAFARLFLRKPRFAFLDEATSALDEDNQHSLYEMLQKSGIGFVSVGHRQTLAQYHERILHLEIDGTWEVQDAAAAGEPESLSAA